MWFKKSFQTSILSLFFWFLVVLKNPPTWYCNGEERIMAEVFQKGSSGSDWTYMAWVDITLSVWRYTMLTNRCYFLISVLLLNIILLFKTSISITWRKIVSIINSVLFFFFFMYHVDFFFHIFQHLEYTKLNIYLLDVFFFEVNNRKAVTLIYHCLTIFIKMQHVAGAYYFASDNKYRCRIPLNTYEKQMDHTKCRFG